MGSLFSVKLAPGLRLSATGRGLRAHVGPRAARVHAGAGRPGVSTGAGPFTYYTSGSSSRRPTMSRPGSGDTAAVSRQLATMAKAEEKAAHAETLHQAFLRIETLHHAEFAPARQPIAPPPPPIDVDAIFQHHAAQARSQTSPLRLRARDAALEAAANHAAGEVEALRRSHSQHQKLWQAALEESWLQLQANEPSMVMAVLSQAFDDNDAAAAPLGVDGAHAAIAVLVPNVDEVPERMPTTTTAGNLSLKKLNKTERNAWYTKLVAGYTLVTAKEAFAVAPGIDEVSIVSVRPDSANGPPGRMTEAVMAARFTRQRFEGRRWRDSTSSMLLGECAEEILTNQRGRAKELYPVDLAGHPELAAILAAVDMNGLQT